MAEKNDVPPSSDWFLERLVNMAEHGLGFGITLQVDGLLVSGTLASTEAYFNGFASDLSGSSVDPKISQAFKDAVPKLTAGPVPKLKPADLPESVRYAKQKLPPSDDETSPRYIHLQDARFYHVGRTFIPENRGVWWRGRISEVSGFTLGTLGFPKA